MLICVQTEIAKKHNKREVRRTWYYSDIRIICNPLDNQITIIDTVLYTTTSKNFCSCIVMCCITVFEISMP